VLGVEGRDRRRLRRAPLSIGQSRQGQFKRLAFVADVRQALEGQVNNAIAGALNIITNKPSTDSYSGYVRALYGEYGQYATEAAVNVPISDQLAVRIAGIVDGQDGWQKNPYVGEDQPNGNDQALRVSLLWTPTDNFDAVLKVEGSQNKLNTGNVIGDCPPPAPFTASGFCADALAQKVPTGFNSDIDTSGPGHLPRIGAVCARRAGQRGRANPLQVVGLRSATGSTRSRAIYRT
jgi:outer membrane receptor protein involved in Fe transport